MYIYITLYTVLEIAVITHVILKCLIFKVVLKSPQNEEMNNKQHNSNRIEVVKTIVMLNVVLLVTAFPLFLPNKCSLFKGSKKYRVNWLVFFILL